MTTGYLTQVISKQKTLFSYHPATSNTEIVGKKEDWRSQNKIG